MDLNVWEHHHSLSMGGHHAVDDLAGANPGIENVTYPPITQGNLSAFYIHYRLDHLSLCPSGHLSCGVVVWQSMSIIGERFPATGSTAIYLCCAFGSQTKRKNNLSLGDRGWVMLT